MDDVAQQLPEGVGVLLLGAAWSIHRHRVVRQRGELKLAAQQAAVGMGVGAHATYAHWGKGPQFGNQGAVGIKELPRAVALQPILQQTELLWIGVRRSKGHLVGPPEALQFLAMQRSRAGPALGGAQHDHRPGRPHRFTACTSFGADLKNAPDRPIHGGSHGFVHGLRFTAFHENRLPAIAAHQARQLVMRNPRQQGRVGDLVAIQVQHRQHRPIADRVEELVDMPRSGQGSGFGLPITHTGQGD